MAQLCGQCQAMLQQVFSLFGESRHVPAPSIFQLFAKYLHEAQKPLFTHLDQLFSYRHFGDVAAQGKRPEDRLIPEKSSKRKSVNKRIFNEFPYHVGANSQAADGAQTLRFNNFSFLQNLYHARWCLARSKFQGPQRQSQTTQIGL